MPRVNPEAVVDALSVVCMLSGEASDAAPLGTRRPVSAGEVHLFSYLACLLSLYRRRPTAEWGYSFIRSPSGLPFADALVSALESIGHSGLIQYSSDGGYLPTPDGRGSLRRFRSLALMRERIEIGQAACDAAITIPPLRIRDALEAEPGLSVAADRALHATLGFEGQRDVLYAQFEILHRVLKLDVGSLLVPALAWLTYLAESTAWATADQSLTLDEPDAD